MSWVRKCLAAAAVAIASCGIGAAASAQNELRDAIIGLGIQAITNGQGGRQPAAPTPTYRAPAASGPAYRAPAASVPAPRAPRISAQQRQTMELQGNLNALGFDAGPIDGQPGRRTRAAIEAWQLSRGMAPTGQLSAMQRTALSTDVARTTGSPRAAEVAELLEVQTYLSQLGYNPGRPDGVWGPRSQRALDAFRRDSGLPSAVGVLGPNDTAALFQRVHGVMRQGGTLARAAVAPPAAGAVGLPGAPGPGFDCAEASVAAEFAICASSNLMALDRALSSAWLSNETSGAPEAVAAQRAWLAERNACQADSDCIEAVMRRRIGDLGGEAPAAADDPVPVAAALTDEATRLHAASNQVLRAPDGLRRRLALLEIKREPSVLEDATIDAFRVAEAEAAATGGGYEAQAAFRSLNAIEQADARAALRLELIAAAQNQTEVTPEAPLPVALYLPVRLGEFAEGEGLGILGATPTQVLIGDRSYPLGTMAIDLDLPGTRRIAMDRTEASTFIDRVQSALRERTLTQVVWGRVTRIGVDETVESFARQSDTYGTPATFVPERVELHLLERSRQGVVPVAAGASPLHAWNIGTGDGEVPEGGLSALELARSLGLPIEEGRVSVALDRSGGDAAAWAEFGSLAWLGENPDAAREGDHFIPVAAALLSESQKRAFFGAAAYVEAGGDLATMMIHDGYAAYMGDVFPDEFARQDARRTFLEDYYDQILARTPAWPLPVLHRAPVQLGEYDFDTQSFPLQYVAQETSMDDGSPVYRVVQLPMTYLASAERFGRLPDRLEMPADEARVLRQIAGDNRIILAWWASLDWSVDQSALETAFDTYGQMEGRRVGKGALTRLGLFAGPDLSWSLQELDPEQVLMPVPDPEAPSQAEPSPDLPADVAALAQIERATPLDLLGWVARFRGGGDEVYEELARTQNEVRQANEFQEAEVVATLADAIRGAGDGPIWLEGFIELGRYDIESGTFAVSDGSGYQWQQSQGQINITAKLIGDTLFAPIPVEEAVARSIVEMRDRGASMLVLVQPEAMTSEHENYYELLVRPQEVIFYRDEMNTGMPTQVIARRSFAEANAKAQERVERRFETGEFDGLADAQLSIDRHVVDLLLIGDGFEPDDPALDQMLMAAWQHEIAGANEPGPRFFEPDEARPMADWIALHRDAFRSYMAAKAAAAGSHFSVRIVRQTQDQCHDAIEPQGLYNSPGVGEILTGFSEDLSQLMLRRQEAAGPDQLDRRYAFLQSRPSVQWEGCDDWLAAIVLADAIHEGAGLGQSAASVVSFDLERVERVVSNAAVPDVVIFGTAGSTRLEAADGTLGDPIEAAAMNGSDDAAGDAEAPGAAEAGWPDPIEVDAAPAARDLLGLKPGLTMAEATGMVAEFDDVVQVFETTIPIENGSPAERALAYQKIFVRRDGSEALILASYSPDGEVIAIKRRLVTDSGVLPYDQIRSALEAKYGPADQRLDAAHATGWGRGGGSRCFPVPHGTLPLQRIDPMGRNDRLRTARVQPWSLTLPQFNEAAASMVSGCGEVLSYVEEPLERFAQSGFSVTLIDFDRFDAVRAALTADQEVTDFDIEF